MGGEITHKELEQLERNHALYYPGLDQSTVPDVVGTETPEEREALDAEYKRREQTYLNIGVLRLQHRIAEMLAEFEAEYERAVNAVYVHRTGTDVEGNYTRELPASARRLETVQVILHAKEEV